MSVGTVFLWLLAFWLAVLILSYNLGAIVV